jgi:hypothetical protein
MGDGGAEEVGAGDGDERVREDECGGDEFFQVKKLRGVFTK